MVPFGFKFSPTDEEIIQILHQKVFGPEIPLYFIVERNIYEQEPQDLQWDPTVAVNNNEQYYYGKKNDSRQVAGRGWWKATSYLKKIHANERVVGYKRPLTFHRYRDNDRKRGNAIKTNWIMHEYSLESQATELRLCKIKYKGRPSMQKEMEDVRKCCGKCHMLSNDFEASRSTNMQVNIVGEQHQEPQPVQRNNVCLPYSCQTQNMQLQVINELPQPSYDPCLMPFISTNDCFGGEQLQQLELTEQPFPSLWS